MFMLVRTLHILAAIWFTGGVAAYGLTHLAAMKTESAAGIDTLVRMMARFKNAMIRPGGGLLVIFGVWTAYYESWPRFSLEAIGLLVILVPFMVLVVRGTQKLGALSAEAVKMGSVTPALREQMRDPLLRIGDLGLFIIVILFLLLMLFKPA